jgi:hypothetical protein
MSKASKERRNALPATRVSQVLTEIGNPHLKLVAGNGYWYFIFDDGVKFDTYSIYTMRLSDFTVNDWANDGRAFVTRMESK